MYSNQHEKLPVARLLGPRRPLRWEFLGLLYSWPPSWPGRPAVNDGAAEHQTLVQQVLADLFMLLVL